MVDSRKLRERFVRNFLAAWPERDLDQVEVSASLRLYVSHETNDYSVTVSMPGREVTISELDVSETELLATIDELAEHMADEAEGDRWVAREGWREYRS